MFVSKLIHPTWPRASGVHVLLVAGALGLATACGGTERAPSFSGADGIATEDSATEGDVDAPIDAEGGGPDDGAAGGDAVDPEQDAPIAGDDASDPDDAEGTDAPDGEATDAPEDGGERDAGPEEPEKIPCDDGIGCTIGEHILPNGGCGGGLFICGDCAGADCATTADCLPYEDDNACNGRLRCIGARCVVDPDTVVVCSGGSSSPETVRRCNPLTGKCADMPRAEGSTCNDGDACTARDRIVNGQCVGVNVCAPCNGADNGDTCDDGDPCTTATTCQSGRCLGTFTCECAINADCAAAGDGNLCNGIERCQAGACVMDPTTVVHCNRACPSGTCLTGTCVPSIGQCTGKKVPGCAN